MTKEEIRGMAEKMIAETDQFIVDVKLSPSKLAVFIDKPSGITLDECASLNRRLQESLEPKGFLESHDVEVSSPGMDMPLMVPQQYFRRIGSEIAVTTIDGQLLKGILKSAGETGIQLNVVTEKKVNKKKERTETLHDIPYNTIKESKLILNLKFK